MPRLVRLYIRHVLIGFAISALFVAALLLLNVANLAHLVFTSDIGWMAAVMLFFANGIVFAGVQFAIVIMGMGENEDEGPSGGRRDALGLLPARAEPVPVPVKARRPAKRRRDRHDRLGY